MRKRPFWLLGGLLLAYLSIPVLSFAVRFAGSGNRGFGSPGLAGALGTSVLSASLATLIIGILGVPLAFALARSAGRWASLAGVAVQLPLALPPVMSGIVLLYLVGPYTRVGRLFGGHLTDSLTGVVLAQVFVSSPFLIIAARSAFEANDPALNDLAATLGLTRWDRFFRVEVHGAAAGIAAGLLLTWLRALGEYGATVLLAYHPYSLPVFTYVQFSATGIPATQAPTALAIGVALLGLLGYRVAARFLPRGRAELPPAVPPTVVAPSRLSFDLDLAVGEFTLRVAHVATSHRLAIIGPSGAGKSMTLRAIAGLVPAAGQVALDGHPLAGVPVERRQLGYVPQGSALFPGRTVAEQLRFSPRADPSRGAWWLKALGVENLTDRRPAELSGGQRQRVSLAQTLSSGAKVVLLDEPFSALDPPVRRSAARQVLRLQREQGLSTVVVTHDVSEAAMLADEILVIDGGRLLQAGSSASVLTRPASEPVARLVGVQNVNDGIVSSETVLVSGHTRYQILPAGTPAGTPVRWGVRAEHVVLGADGDYEGTVVGLVSLGAGTLVEIAAGGIILEALSRRPAPLGDCRFSIAPADILCWPGQLPTDARARPAVPVPTSRRPPPSG